MADRPARPSVIASAVTTWHDALAATSAMPMVLGVAFAAVLALGALSEPLLRTHGGAVASNMGHELGAVVVGLVRGFLLTPAAIAVHRFVMIGERATSYRLEPTDPRFQRFFVNTIVFQLIIAVPSLAFGMIHMPAGFGALLVKGTAIVLAVGIPIELLRALILFPAVAIDAPGADWANAWHDTNGHSWQVFFIVLAIGIPVFVVDLPFMFLLPSPLRPSSMRTAILVMLDSAQIVLMTAAYAAAASRLFLALADRLARPPGAPAGAATA